MNKDINFKISKHRNRSMFNKAKENQDLSANDIEGLNIQTDNFFTRNEDKQEYSSGAISPLIGSIRNSVVEKKYI